MKPPFLQHHIHQTPRRPTIKSRVAKFVGSTTARINYAYRVEPTWLEVNRIAIPVKGLPHAFHGFRIAQLTDFHCGNQIPLGYLEGVLERTLNEKPDLIALTGDFVHKGYRHVEAAAKLFQNLKAPLGVFAVLGNHDFAVRNALGFRRHRGLHQAISNALEAQGVTVLRNQAVRVERDGQGLVVAGIDDLWSKEADPNAALEEQCRQTPRIVLAHNPQSVELLTQHRADLILSGHTHGGQVDWPGLGRVLLGKKAKRWAAGLYEHDSGHMYVNKGVGFGWRFRVGVRPEVALFTLESTDR
ncbi:MAG TPA: metallophosphoesterase [Gemmata sp.]|nr:metallophosphoesterase [Gemmata sp.]